MACAPSLSGQGGCVAETRSSTFWYLDTTNALVSGRRDTVVTCNPGLTTVTCYDALGVALATCPAAIPVDFAVISGGTALPVTVVTVPVSAPATTCATLDTTVQAADLLSQAVHTTPGTALQVKLCDPVVNMKLEFSETLLYSVSTEQTLVRVREYNEDSGAWVLRYENLDGSAYGGVVPPDATATSAQIQVVRTLAAGCAASVPYSQRDTSRFDSETGALESAVIDWVDSLGVSVSTIPTGFTLGACTPCEPTKQFDTVDYCPPGAGVVARSLVGAFHGISGTDLTSSLTGSFEFLISVDGVQRYGNGAGPTSAAEYPLTFTTLQQIADWLNANPANTAPNDNWTVGFTDATNTVPYIAIDNGVGNPSSNHTWDLLSLIHYPIASVVTDGNRIFGGVIPQSVDFATAGSSRKITTHKTLACDGTLTISGYELDGSVVAGFSATNICQPPANADVEFETLCDVSAAGVATEFVRRTVTTFDNSGTPTTIMTNLTLDYVTAYTPNGTVGACGQDCDTITPVGLVATWA